MKRSNRKLSSYLWKRTIAITMKMLDTETTNKLQSYLAESTNKLLCCPETRYIDLRDIGGERKRRKGELEGA